MTVSGHFSWPLPGSYMAASGQFLVAAVTGLTMTAQQDGHGLGIIAGASVAAVVLLRPRALAPESGKQR